MALKFHRALLGASFSRIYPGGIPDAVMHTLRNFPLTVKTLHKWFPLASDFTIYAVCPTCSRLYPPVNGNYPVMCNWDEFEVAKKKRRERLASMGKPTTSDADPDQGIGQKPKRGRKSKVDSLDPSPCNTILVHNPQQPTRPIRPFKHRSFKEWLSKLLSRPGLHKSMDSAWTRGDNADGFLRDIWDGSILRNFLGPDGNLFSSPQEEKTYLKDGKLHVREGKTHLVFSLNVDWFNPYGRKQAGVKRSVGIIALVCLNLPPKERYRRENMYLAGVIPGPNEPSPEQLNHFLSPVIDDFLPFWAPGVQLSCTADFPKGRVIHAAIVPVVADLPAARKVHGSAGTTATRFCALCLCRRKKRHGFEPSKWPKRPCNKWIKRAQEWKDAVGLIHCKNLFNKYGVRWTPLLNLPYWDPTEFVVVDSMHNLFLGLFKNHCLEILGVDITLGTEDEPNPPTEKELSSVRKLLETSNLPREILHKRLSNRRKPILQELCRIVGGVPRGVPSASNKSRPIIRKKDISTAILNVYFSDVRPFVFLMNATLF
jgi:hypothetical protein